MDSFSVNLSPPRILNLSTYFKIIIDIPYQEIDFESFSFNGGEIFKNPVTDDGTKKIFKRSFKS